MTAPSYAHGQLAQQQRQHKARQLARWCYDRGIGPAVSHQPPPVLRSVAKQAGVSAPHHEPDGSSPTWTMVSELLTARAGWDRAHGQQAPAPPVQCIACTVLQQPCRQCADRVLCRGCGGRMDPVLIDERLELHPTCQAPAPAAPASHEQEALLHLN